MVEGDRPRVRIAVIIAAIVLFAAGLILVRSVHRVQTWTLARQTKIVWSAPFGESPGALAVERGMDGRVYGPLGFAAAGQRFWIADTYQHRLVSAEAGKPWRVTELGDRLPEDLISSAQGLYFVDNQKLAVYRVSGRKIAAVIQLPPSPGYSEAIWHLAAYGGDLLLEGIKIGKGQTETWLAKYTASGQFAGMLNESEGSADTPFHVAMAYPIATVVRSFQVSPSGCLYIEAAGNDRFRREVLVYNGHNQFLRQGAGTVPGNHHTQSVAEHQPSGMDIHGHQFECAGPRADFGGAARRPDLGSACAGGACPQCCLWGSRSSRFLLSPAEHSISIPHRPLDAVSRHNMAVAQSVWLVQEEPGAAAAQNYAEY
jgi:hypothetical protein